MPKKESKPKGDSASMAKDEVLRAVLIADTFSDDLQPISTEIPDV